MKTTRLGTVFVLCLALTCCSILESGKPARQVYLLKTPAAPSHAGQAEKLPRLHISVRAIPGLDTDRILILGHDARVNPVANAHWPDHMPEVFTSISRRYLSNLNQFLSVDQASIARPGEWKLELELQAFYGVQEYAGNTTAVVLQLEGLLQCGETRQVMRISQKTTVGSDSLSILVAAHQQVVDAAMQDLSSGIIASCEGVATDPAD